MNRKGVNGMDGWVSKRGCIAMYDFVGEFNVPTLEAFLSFQFNISCRMP